MSTRPKDIELVVRMISDAAARVEIDLEPLLEKVVERVRGSDQWNPMIAADEIADEVFGDIWYDEPLGEAYAARSPTCTSSAWHTRCA
jgi:hypothetical protein